MKIIRTILWVLVAFGFLIFAIYNWQPVELRLWQNLVLETKVPMLALLAFVLGFVPMWAYHQSIVWGLQRRIRTLENSLKQAAMARASEPLPAPAPVAPVDSPVEKFGTQAGDSLDPLSPADPALDGAAK